MTVKDVLELEEYEIEIEIEGEFKPFGVTDET